MSRLRHCVKCGEVASIENARALKYHDENAACVSAANAQRIENMRNAEMLQ